ncbi:hypothetical protein [Pseudomaricurvus sp. HS19]|uniref:hypothetical protein n=1 Tax=Pseudomaricurvus sp. HS19 TaxID=2692626 RepID=UPI00136873C3|nr:hypothetical protein [Pseudomaricurvus sp. HS19]MYM62949.1 hypothetical protein [Pseudomaricurvus sp. HS19]
MSEIYQAPQAQLTDAPQDITRGSVESALRGEYSLQTSEVISEAWARVSGTKWKFQLALLIYMLIYVAVVVGLRFVFHAIGLDSGIYSEAAGAPGMLEIMLAGTFIESMILMFVTTPLWVGLGMMGVRRAVDGPLKSTDILQYYRAIVPLGITMILMYVLLVIGFLLLIIPGIYLSIAYSMALYLVVDKKMSPWRALETSRKAVTKHWFPMFGLMFVLALFNLIGMIPLGIGLIWTYPLLMIALGIAYRNMFGVESEKDTVLI